MDARKREGGEKRRRRGKCKREGGWNPGMNRKEHYDTARTNRSVRMRRT